MKIPILSGTIARRLLVNSRAAPDVVSALLPAPFRPQLFNGHALVGICLIRLEQIRPAWMPGTLGMSSENAAHRFAVVWDDGQGNEQTGVYIARRDTGSHLNAWGGGRLFPGEHHFAKFDVRFEGNELDFSMRSDDGEVEVRLQGRPTRQWPAGSCFGSLQEASEFFRGGARGFSPRLRSEGVDGLRLETSEWKVEAFEASEVNSSFYSDEGQFPRGSVQYDHTLLMRDIAHRWHALASPTMTSTAECC